MLSRRSKSDIGRLSSMKRILVFSLLSCALLVACGPSADQRERNKRAAHRPPFGYNADESAVAPEPTPKPTPAPITSEPKPTPGPQATPTPAPAKKETNTYGKTVPGKPGFVTSPYSPDSGLVDVRGYPPGTPVKDPYTGKIFLVP